MSQKPKVGTDCSQGLCPAHIHHPEARSEGQPRVSNHSHTKCTGSVHGHSRANTGATITADHNSQGHCIGLHVPGLKYWKLTRRGDR